MFFFGVTTLNGNEFIYVVDHANTKLKIFENHLKFILQKSLHLRPFDICSLNSEENAVLLTETAIVAFGVARLEIKHLRYIRLATFGHSITAFQLRLILPFFHNVFNSCFHGNVIQIHKSVQSAQ